MTSRANRGLSTRKLIFLALLVAGASVLHVIESYIPMPVPVPGAKLGLANAVTLLTVFMYGGSEALWVVVLRVLLGSLLSGTLLGPTFLISLGGGLFSLVVMLLIHKCCTVFSVVGVSIWGAIGHNVMQLLLASVLVHSLDIMWYLPYLMLMALPAGVFIGFVVRSILPGVQQMTTKLL